MKDSRVENPKFKPQKSKAPAFQHLNSIQTSEQGWKEKKKKDKQYWGQNPQDSTTATGVNLTNTLGGYLSGSGGSRPQKNISQVTCFNCNKKRHYSNKFPKPSKPKN